MFTQSADRDIYGSSSNDKTNNRLPTIERFQHAKLPNEGMQDKGLLTDFNCNRSISGTGIELISSLIVLHYRQVSRYQTVPSDRIS